MCNCNILFILTMIDHVVVARSVVVVVVWGYTSIVRVSGHRDRCNAPPPPVVHPPPQVVPYYYIYWLLFTLDTIITTVYFPSIAKYSGDNFNKNLLPGFQLCLFSIVRRLFVPLTLTIWRFVLSSFIPLFTDTHLQPSWPTGHLVVLSHALIWKI